MTDLAALDTYLSSDDSPEECMMLSELDGFLHGVACSPVPIPIEEWMPVALGSTPEQVSAWVFEAIKVMYLNILKRLVDDRQEAKPIFWQAKDGHFIAMDWCEGFMDAVKLRPKKWLRLLDSNTHGQFIIPIIVHLLSEDDNSEMATPQEQLDKTLAEAAEKIPQSVVEINRFWRENWE